MPPDFFSKTGQLWGNPLYDWAAMRRDGYAWWTARFKAMTRLSDVIRLDHFRGFCGFYAVPRHHTDARRGRWIKGPGADFFAAVRKKMGDLPFIAEDLGEITPDVIALRDEMGLPGMKILQFGLGEPPESTFLPHNYTPVSIAYTATHDNDTSRGWFESLPAKKAALALKYADCGRKQIVREMLRLCWASVSDRAIAPLQDVLDLPTSAGMNFPGTPTGNWRWRAGEEQVSSDRLQYLAEITRTYGRWPGDS